METYLLEIKNSIRYLADNKAVAASVATPSKASSEGKGKISGKIIDRLDAIMQQINAYYAQQSSESKPSTSSQSKTGTPIRKLGTPTKSTPSQSKTGTPKRTLGTPTKSSPSQSKTGKGKNKLDDY